jgi:hypothetical protein
MIGFKQYLNETKREEYDYEGDYHDPAGPSALFAHYASLDELDPYTLAHMHANVGKGSINENDLTAHALLKQKMSQAPKNPEAQSKVDGAVKAALRRHVSAYGREIGAPLTRSAATEVGRKAVESHYKKSPEEQASDLRDAAARIGYVSYNDKNMSPNQVSARLAGGNKKTDTVINNPIATYKGKLTSSVSSYGGAAGAYTHFASASGKTTHHVITCPHGTTGCMVGHSMAVGKENAKLGGVGPSCLALSGGFGFVSTRQKVQVNSHIRSGGDGGTGGPSTTSDHAILTAHRLSQEAAKASKAGTIHAVRSQTTDQRGEDIRAIANQAAKSNPNIKKNTVLFGYSKNPKEVVDAARATKSKENIPEYIVHSHPGPAYHQDKDGKLILNQSNIRALKNLRAAHKTAKDEGLNISDYVVAGGNSLDRNGNAVANTVHRQPKRNAKADEKARFSNLDSSVRKVRYWDLHHSGELNSSEPETQHNDRTGIGYTTITQDGKRLKIKYYDRKANPGATNTGRTVYSQRHDARYSDAETNAPYANVTAPVASTSNENTFGGEKSMFHQMHVSYDMHGNKLRHSQIGMLHDAHPDLMQKAGYRYDTK